MAREENMKKQKKKDETELLFRSVRDLCKKVRGQGKVGREIAQDALTIASIYWLCRLCSTYPDIPGLKVKIMSDPVTFWGTKIEHIFRRSGLSITELR
jgi:hypothetical protein